MRVAGGRSNLGRQVSAVVVAPERMVLREFPIPEPGPREALLRVECVGICGSDPHLFRKRVDQGGVFPLILGHEVVGFIADIGDEASSAYGVGVGDRVVVEPYIRCGECQYCLNGHYQLCPRKRCYGVNISAAEPPHLWGAYGEYTFLAPGSRLHKVGATVPAPLAAMASVIGNGIRWIRTKAEVRFGESVVIIGAGAQGLATTMAAREAGADPIIVLGLGRDRDRLRVAREFGAHRVIDIEGEEPLGAVAAATGGEMADVVVECSGSLAGAPLGIDLLKPLGRLVIMGITGDRAVPLVTDKIALKELRVIGGLGQSLNVEQAIRLIESGRYAIGRMVTHSFPTARAEEALRFFTAGHPECNRVVLFP